MLIEKLNYLVFKDKAVNEPGGVLNAYQLTDKSANVSDVGKQCGWIFYVPAAYTSKIDPKTGFANLFITKGLTNVEKKKAFFEKFDAVRYDEKEECFVFSIDYSKLCDNADYHKKWDIYTRGERHDELFRYVFFPRRDGRRRRGSGHEGKHQPLRAVL